MKRKAIHQKTNVYQALEQRTAYIDQDEMFQVDKIVQNANKWIECNNLFIETEHLPYCSWVVSSGNIKMQRKWKFYLENIMPTYKSQMQRSINDYQMHSPEIV